MPSLREKLKALEELQQIDLETNEVRAELDAIAPKRAELDEKVRDARKAYDDQKARLDGNERERRSIETLLTMERDKVKKWEGRLGEIRTPREYAALSREIDIAKKSNVTMAEELVELGKQVATQRTAAAAKETDFNTRQKDLGAKMTELRSKLADAESGVKGLEGKREEASKGVDPTLLKRYDHVRKKRMPAMAAVVAPGTCTGCRMNVPPQLYNTLLTTLGYDVCPNCQRIIHAAQALEQPAAK